MYRIPSIPWEIHQKLMNLMQKNAQLAKSCTSLHGAVIVKRGKKEVIGLGCNGWWGKGIICSSGCSLHAEVAALKDVCKKKRTSDLRGSIMLVSRLCTTDHNKVMRSRPCTDCLVRLRAVNRKYGLEAVYWTTGVPCAPWGKTVF